MAPSIGATASVRRLHFEAEVIVTASLKAAVEAPTSESVTPKAIPFAERSARLAHIRAKRVPESRLKLCSTRFAISLRHEH